MAFASVAALLDALRQASLLEPAQLAELARLPAEQFAQPRALAGELVRRGWLTPYQVNQLFQGRASSLVLGSFVLLERLGEGGMGQVFKARQHKLGRIVALKVIRTERLDSPDAVRRFRREIQAAAQLSHPNIVLALDADEHEGTHFFAMEHVEGIDLAKHVKQNGPLPVAQACECIRQAALGLQHAFERGLVHRDIKPHNLLLTRQGVVKVLDMGLARVNVQGDDEYASSTLTQEGTVMGTPDYIAPEQALDSRTADIRADLYSLGCTFYYLLTGRVPYPGGTVMEKLLKHQSQPPPSVFDRRPDVPPPVAAVVHRLMAKRPADRYQTPAELVAALAAARAPGAGVPPPAAIPAAPLAASDDTFADLRPDTTPTGDRRRQSAEHKRLLLLGGAGVAILGALVLLLVLLFKGGSKDRSDPRQTPPPIETAGTESADRAWRDLRTRGEAAGVDRSKLRDELLAFRQTYPGTRPAHEAAEWLLRLPSPLDALAVMPLSPEQKLDGQPKELLAVLGDHRSWVGASHTGWAGYSPDGRWIACNTGSGTLRLLDPSSLAVKAELRVEGDAWLCFDFRRDGKQIATTGMQSVALWDLGDGQPRRVHLVKDFPGRPGNPAFSPDGKLLAVPCGTQPPTVRLWDLSGAEPKESAVLTGHTEGIGKPTFSPDGKTMVTGGQDHTIRVWDLSGPQPRTRAVLRNHTYWVVSVAFSPDGKLLASSGQHDLTVRLWDMTAAEPKELSVQQQNEAMNNVAFSPDGKRLASGFWDRTWGWWDVSEKQLKPLSRVPDHANIGTNVSFSPDGRSLVTSCDDGTLHLWDCTQDPPRQRLVSPGHAQAISGLAFSPDDRRLVSMSADRSVRVYDLQATALHPRTVLTVPPGPVCGAFQLDGRTLVTSDGGSKLVFWDVDSGKERRALPGHDGLVTAATYSPDGKVLLTAGADNVLKFWDVETGDLKRLERLDQAIHAVAFHPDGRSVAVACGKGIVQIWHARQSQLRATCKGPEEDVTAVAFSPDGKTVASGGKDGRARLWDAATGRERSSLPGHEKDIRFLTFTCDGKQLVSAGMDGRVIVRDSTTGKEQQTLQVPLPIHTAALAGDGRHLAAGNIDGTVYLLRLGVAPR